MSRNTTDLISKSLRGRIWLAVVALAVSNCIFGLLAYLAASYFSSNTFFIVFTTFVMTSVCTVIFGGWMSNEILLPIEKVSLLAKSLERGSAVSLPKTTGSRETDELLQTLHRSNQQLQNLIEMMDSVSSGDTAPASISIENSDRLSASFQKLVSKVAGSVDAGHELGELQTAVRQLASDLSGLKNGNLNIEIRGGFAATREISEAVRLLVSRQGEIIRHVQAHSLEADRSALEAKKLIRTAIANDDARSRKIKRAAHAFKHAPDQFEQISSEVAAALFGASKLLEDFESGKQFARESSDANNALRKEITAASQKIQLMDGQSLAIKQVSKLVDDLARRSNLIALNTSIQAGSANGGTVSLIADEIASLSERALHVNKEISIIIETIGREVEQAQAALISVTAVITDISTIAAKGDDTMTRLGPFFEGLVHLPAKIEAAKSDASSDKRQLLSILDECSSDAADCGAILKDCESMISNFTVPLENLRDSATGLVFSPKLKMEVAEVPDFTADDGFGSLTENVQTTEVMELQGEI